MVAVSDHASNGGEEYGGEDYWADASDMVDGDSTQPGVRVPVLAVVGRPNVGKSTLVNRILGSRQAVVQDVPGVTRDRVTYDASWRGRAFTVVDTGGWEPFPGAEEGQQRRELAEQVTAQAQVAVEAADAVLFVLDAIVGVTDADDAVAAVLRRAGQTGCRCGKQGGRRHCGTCRDGPVVARPGRASAGQRAARAGERGLAGRDPGRAAGDPA